MNFYPHHIGDFNNDTRHLTRIERSIYRDLIELYYDTESPLIPDKDKLSRLVLASSKDELTAVEQVLNEFFDYTENGYFHSRCHEVICEYKKNIKGKSKAGIASAKARKARKLKALSDLEDGQQPLNTCTTPVRNQKPETRNQKPIKEIVIPDGINATAWQEWIDYRKEKKKSVSKTAATKQFKLLLQYNESQQQEIINYSIQNDYQGLFKLKAASNEKYTVHKNKRSSTVSRVRENAARERRQVENNRPMGNNDSLVREPVDEHTRGGGGRDTNMGSIIEGSFRSSND